MPDHFFLGTPAISRHLRGFVRMPRRLLLSGLIACAFECPGASGEDRNLALVCDLDPLIDTPAVFELTPETLETKFAAPEGFTENPYFKWLTRTKDRAVFLRHPFVNVSVELTLLKGALPVEEVIADFMNGKLNCVTFSVYNRGDAGSISAEEFKRRLQACDQALRTRLGSLPSPRRADTANGLLSSGSTWFSPGGLATLEMNPEAESGRPDYLKMRIAPRDAKGAIATAIRQHNGCTSLTQLKKNVQLDGSRALIQGIPMVDQGDKGYCVVASAQRLFEYYGISCDQHQLAKIARSDPGTGTGTREMVNALDRLDQVFHLEFKNLLARYTDGSLREPKKQKQASLAEFQKSIEHYVGDGIPLLWGLELGKFPEQPELNRQTSGAHMRLIVGFDKDNIYFSDSWGAGHELGRMSTQHAFDATNGLFVMHPTLR